MSLRRAATIALLLACAACVPRAPAPTPTPPVERPVARPTPTPSPVPTYSTWMDVPQTPGDWRYVPTTTGSEARYGDAASEPRFALRCVRSSRTVELVRFGPATGNGAMTVRTESATRAVAGAADGSALRAALSASDPLLDAMAFSKGRFAIEAPGAPPLYLPSWPEVTRVIEDCR